MFKILYEDNHLIVCYKPKGVLSQADNTEHEDMLSLIKNHLKIKYNKPGNVYLGLVHRLDINTSGVMVFAKTSKAASRLSEQISNHQFEKKYLAIVENDLYGCGTLTDYLIKDEKEKKAYLSPNGKMAILEYQVIKNSILNNQKVSLVDITLKTGRFHQIRCQFANFDHPIYGDKKYGSKNINSKDAFPLEAYHLGFFHPITKEWLVFEYKTLSL